LVILFNPLLIKSNFCFEFKILGLIAIGMECYAYQNDALWNERFEKHGNHICKFIKTLIPQELQKKLDELKLMPSTQYETDEESKSDSEIEHLDEEALHKVNVSDKKPMEEYFFQNLIRRDSNEAAFLSFSLFCTAAITIHLICSCTSKNLMWRHKWVKIPEFQAYIYKQNA